MVAENARLIRLQVHVVVSYLEVDPNKVHQGDIVPAIPMSQWRYRKHGDSHITIALRHHQFNCKSQQSTGLYTTA